MRILFGAFSTPRPFSAGYQCNWYNWVEGLKRLGHDVIFIEQVPFSNSLDGNGKPVPLRESLIYQQFNATMEKFGVGKYCCLKNSCDYQICGLPPCTLEQMAKDADLLINISGCITDDAVMQNVKCRAYFDDDPVYTQLWHTAYGVDVGLNNHNVWLTAGLNIGTPFSPIPDCGLSWFPVRRPIVPELWSSEAPAGDNFTTIAAWKVFGDLFYEGECYRSKAYELERFILLPSHTDQPVEIMLREDWGERQAYELLKSKGWKVFDAATLASIENYIGYINKSRAELGIAKHAYVKSRSGWFSDRAAQYLACGRPVIHQSTGFERILPTGNGVLPFTDMDDLVAAIDSINTNYPRHCRQAREFTHEFLHYSKVIPPILEHCATPKNHQDSLAIQTV